MKQQQDETKQRYKVYSYRLHDGTAELIKELSHKTELSYNKLLFRMAKFYEEKVFWETNSTPNPQENHQ